MVSDYCFYCKFHGIYFIHNINIPQQVQPHSVYLSVIAKRHSYMLFILFKIKHKHLH